MNERIQQLAEQAGWGKGETYDDCMQCSPFDPEIFAELIVRECADIGERYADGNYEVRNQILERFGVEE